jgi:hypothetical protein
MAKIVLTNYTRKHKTRRPGVHSKNASRGQTVIRNNIEAKDANGNTTIYRKNTI